MRKASTQLLEQGTQTPSPAPNLIPAENEKQLRTYIEIGTADGGTSVADVEVEDEYQFERGWYGSNPEQLQRLAEWLIEQQVAEVAPLNTGNRFGERWSGIGNHSVRSGKV